MEPNKQRFLKEQDPTGKHSVIIFNKKFEVRAPLPEEFGMTYGSEYSMPFDTNSMSETWAKAFAVVGVANKVGIRMKKLYTNPEPTEISVDMEFNAYYDAIDEVLKPVFALSQMTLGTALKFQDLTRRTQEVLQKMSNFANGVGESVGLSSQDDQLITSNVDLAASDTVNDNVNGVLRLIGFIQAPLPVTVYYGNVMTWENMYITSVSTQFSNSLDSNGIPMSAKCTVSLTPQQYPIAEDIQDVFSKSLSRGR